MATFDAPDSITIARADRSSCLPVAMRLSPKPARKMPSYLSFDEASSAVLPGSSVHGSPASQRPLELVSVKRSPQTPDSVTVPSQSGFSPKGVIERVATPTFNVDFAALARPSRGSDGEAANSITMAKASRLFIASLSLRLANVDVVVGHGQLIIMVGH